MFKILAQLSLTIVFFSHSFSFSKEIEKKSIEVPVNVPSAEPTKIESAWEATKGSGRKAWGKTREVGEKASSN